ncbi:helix-turn-helix transcriptional regulator [Spirosoma areae]
MGHKAFVIDQDLAEDLISTLAECRQTLIEMRQQLAEASQMADQNTQFSIQQACTYLSGINEDTLLYYRKLGLDYYKKGKNSVWYRKGDIDAWLASGQVNQQKR